MAESIRIDVWLWAARFFKTRPLATEAVNGGRVHLNGVRIKAGRQVKPGDVLEINKNSFNYRITVLALNKKRRPATEAQQLYREDETSIKDREKQLEQLKLASATQIHPSGRPGKHERGRIIRFKRGD